MPCFGRRGEKQSGTGGAPRRLLPGIRPYLLTLLVHWTCLEAVSGAPAVAAARGAGAGSASEGKGAPGWARVAGESELHPEDPSFQPGKTAEAADDAPPGDKAAFQSDSAPSAFSPAPDPRTPPAGAGAAPPRRIPEVSGPVYRKVKSIPYPNRTFYVSKGILGGIAFGKHRNLDHESSLFQWQGEATFFYAPWFSAGVGGKITAGEPSDTSQEIRTRYVILARFHKAWSHFAVYAGPQLGLDNLNLFSSSPGDTLSFFQKPQRNTNAGLGLDLGLGWRLGPMLGVTLGGNLEYTAVQSLNFRLLPGAALDLLAFADRLREVVPALWLFAEYQAGLMAFDSRGHRRDWSMMGGLGLAF